MRGQASVEMMVTLGIVIAFLIPVLLLLLVASQYGTENSAVYQAQAASHTVADTINTVFIQGNGASTRLLINLPSSAETFSISGREVIITLKLASGDYDAASPSFANVTNVDPIEAKGLLPLLIENKGGVIEVSKNG